MHKIKTILAGLVFTVGMASAQQPSPQPQVIQVTELEKTKIELLRLKSEVAIEKYSDEVNRINKVYSSQYDPASGQFYIIPKPVPVPTPVAPATEKKTK